MASYYILKPLRDAYLLQSTDITAVAKVHVVVAACTLATVQVYAWLVRLVAGRSLSIWIYGSFVVTVVLFQQALVRGVQVAHEVAFAWVFYVWVSIFSVFAVTVFWSLAHDIFTPEEGSEWYGLIGAADILGGFVGGAVTTLLVSAVGLPNLLLVSAGMLIPCVGIASWLKAHAPSVRVKRDASTGGKLAAWPLFRSSPYLCAIFLFVFLFQGLSVLVDNQASLVVRANFHSTEATARFKSNVYLGMNLVGFLLNVFVTGRLQTRFGPLPGMLAVPIAALFGALGFVWWPTIAVTVLVTVVGLAMGYSILQSAKELLYLPVPSSERYVAKGFIDTFGFRLGNGLAAVWLWWLVPPLGSVSVCGAIFLASAGMIAAALWLAPRHSAMLETSSN